MKTQFGNMTARGPTVEKLFTIKEFLKYNFSSQRMSAVLLLLHEQISNPQTHARLAECDQYYPTFRKL